MEKTDKIFVAGHAGLVGGAVVRALQARGCANLVLRRRAELDLREQAPVRQFFEANRPDYVIVTAATVGGIGANARYPARFIYDNMLIAANVIDAAWRSGCKKLLFLGSSCIYPKFAPQPIPENALLSGPLEPTNDAYALAKICGLRMAAAYRQQYGFDAISVMPCNLYGEGDNFQKENSHVIPALMRRFHEAKLDNAPKVAIWGTGTPLREFLHVDDLAMACLFLLENYSDVEHVNVGSGKEISILNLARMLAEIVGYAGEIVTDASRPDGTPRKLLDITKISGMGWRPSIGLREGLSRTYAWFQRQETVRK